MQWHRREHVYPPLCQCHCFLPRRRHPVALTKSLFYNFAMTAERDPLPGVCLSKPEMTEPGNGRPGNGDIGSCHLTLGWPAP